MEIGGLYKRKTVCILLFTVIVLFAGAGNAFAMSGKVISVTDGDTIVVLTEDNIRQNVRLASIDAPERNQYFGNTAKQFLSDHVLGRDVSVTEDTFDRYGRLVGVVTVDRKNMNEEMVANGMAWVYDLYLNQPRDSVFLLRQAYARYNEVGLWVDDSPIPPWEFRNRKSSQ